MELFLASAYVYCCIINRNKSLSIRVVKPSISFSGCACQFNFYAGVNKYCIENFNTNDVTALCVSGGTFAAVPLVLGKKTSDWIIDDWNSNYEYWTNRPLYLWLDSQEFIRNMWRNYLPDDAYKQCNNRLYIVISRIGLYGLYPEAVSTYTSNEDLIDAIMCTSHVPGLFVNLPTHNGKLGFDGCFTCLKPRSKDTLVVTLFGRGDIDYANKIPLTNMFDVIHPELCGGQIEEAFNIVAKYNNLFVKAGFRPKTY